MAWFEEKTQKLMRITSTGQYLPVIDGLRCAAIVPVVLFHLYAFVGAQPGVLFSGTPANSLVHRMLLHGGTGVPLFFVISAFIISLPFAGYYQQGIPKPDLGYYFFRRLTRIEPPYIVCMLLFACVLIWNGSFGIREALQHLGINLLYLNSVVFSGSMSEINPVVWSLEVEVQFYLLAPLLCSCFALKRVVRVAILIAVMVSAAWLQWQCRTFILSPLFLTGNLQYFAAGFLLTDLYLLGLSPSKNAGWAYTLAGIVLYPAILLVGWKSTVARFVLPFLIVALFVAVFRSPLLRKAFSGSVVTVIGGMCYSIYLLHNGIIQAVGPYFNGLLGGTGGMLAFGLLTGAAIVGVSAAFFVVIERPCMNPAWPRRFLRRLGTENSKDGPHSGI